MSDPQILELARQLRKNQTPAEKFFWSKVRSRRFLGKKFRRQHIVEFVGIAGHSQYFIADFYCAEHNLIVELDGKIHVHLKEYDQIREDVLRDMGLRVIRFKNEDLFDDWSGVVEKLKAFLV